MRQRSRPSPLLLLPMLLLPACSMFGGDGDEYDPLAATILRVEVEPNPVVVGDTATFTVVIAESTATGLEFWWDVSTPGDFATTKVNEYKWQASVPPGDYNIAVRVSRPGQAFEDVQSSTDFTVVAR